jgi:hypothetical protein
MIVTHQTEPLAGDMPDRVNVRVRPPRPGDLDFYAEHPELIDRRLDALDREWDAGRTVEVNAAVLGLTGLLLGAVAGRRWLLIAAAAQGVMLRRALRGWTPASGLLRGLGVRTRREIDQERAALLELRRGMHYR